MPCRGIYGARKGIGNEGGIMRKEDLRFGPEYTATIRGRLGQVWSIQNKVELLNAEGVYVGIVPISALQLVEVPGKPVEFICGEHGTDHISHLAKLAHMNCTCPEEPPA